MNTYTSEQKCLLPIAASTPEPATQRRTFVNRHHDLIELLTLAFILFLAASQCLLLYGIHSFPYTTPSSALCIFLADLASGLRISIPASLPTATLLFLATPYIARPEWVEVSWYSILLCYLVGSTWGALLLLWV